MNKKSEKQKILISIEYIQDYAIIQQKERQKLIKEFESYNNLSKKEKEEEKDHLSYLKNSIDNQESFNTIYKKISSEDIREFYEFSSQIEVMNVRIHDWDRFHSTTYLFLYGILGDWEKQNLYDKLFGKPDYHYDETPDAQVRYYKFPMSKIDKIIGIKRNLVVDSFDKDEYEYNGETKEYVLDLHQFDENIHQILKSYDVI